jgi:hypothetical protein
MVREAAGTFHYSIVITLFHAKLLFVLDEFDAVGRECRRALAIGWPNDPDEDDLPLVSISGKVMMPRYLMSGSSSVSCSGRSFLLLKNSGALW